MKSSTATQLPNSRSAMAAALVSFSISTGIGSASVASSASGRSRQPRFGAKRSRPDRSISAGTPMPIARCGSGPRRFASLSMAARSAAIAAAGSASPGIDSRSRMRPLRSAATVSIRSGSSRTPKTMPAERGISSATAGLPSRRAVAGPWLRATSPAPASCEVTAEMVALSRPVSAASSRCELPGCRRSAFIRSTALTLRTQAEFTPLPAVLGWRATLESCGSATVLTLMGRQRYRRINSGVYKNVRPTNGFSGGEAGSPGRVTESARATVDFPSCRLVAEARRTSMYLLMP